MCGLAGLWGTGGPEALAAMTEAQRHRGPDDGGVWDARLPDGTYLGLGSRRLAIIDLSEAGHMPMANEDGSVVLAYNGELYDAPSLRDELEGRGARFRSRTDTEVVLRAVEAWGPDAVDRLEGMFAFAAVDLREEPTLLLARDAFGVKPLYYRVEGGSLAFASEVKSFRALPDFQASVDPRALHRLLTFLWVPEPHTLFQGVRTLPPGHLAVWRGGGGPARDGFHELRRYWTPELPGRGHAFPADEEEVVREVRDRFRAAVRSQMVSDVPLGAFLSGGLDSSGIVAAMAEASDEAVRTYTITFPEEHRVGEKTLDDPAVARRTAEHFGCRHHEIVVEPDVADLLPGLVAQMDEPVGDPAILTAYLVCREARPTTTVLLSGVGGDEVYAGYRKHAAHRVSALYARLPRALRTRLLEPAVRGLPTFRGTPLMGTVRLAKKLARSGSLPEEEAFLMNATYLDGEQKAGLYAPGLAAELAGADPYDVHRGHLAETEHADFLNRMLHLDLTTFMPSLNLLYNDKMSMASSLEVRVPFLDRGLVQHAFDRVSPDMKLRGGVRPETKHVFRRAMEGMVPDEVLRQPKAGFGAPHDHWLVHDLREMVDDLLAPDLVRRRGLFDPDAVSRMIREHRDGTHDWAYPLWLLLTLELWQRAFVDG